MKALILDVEGPLDGNPFNPEHRLSMCGIFDGSEYGLYDLEHSGAPYGQSIKSIQAKIDSSDVLVAFNAKYDLHWLRRYGLKFQHKKLWCLQYAEWCLSGQTGWPRIYPDLDTACERRNIPGKSDYIYTTYWSKKIETVEIPWQELADYNKQDLKCEWDLFQAQIQELKEKTQLKKLIWHGCQDILVTQEMEWNGIAFNKELSIQIGNELLEQIKEVEKQLNALVC